MSYGPRVALRGLSFTLDAGRILGFLGPNGAGKTTAIRILTTILEPTGGRFAVDGIDSANPDEIRRRIGVLPESLGFYKQMTGAESLTFFGRLYGRTARAAKANAAELLKEVGLDQRSKSLVGTYSRGMRQRLGIARALVHNPAVIFLDEPTLGLDPRGQQELLELIRQIAHEREVGIVLCSHVLSDIEVVCDDVLILNQGQVVAAGTVAEVMGRTEHDDAPRNEVRVHVPASAIARACIVLGALQGVAGASPSASNDGWVRVQLAVADEGMPDASAQMNNQILKALLQVDIPILGFDTDARRLHDVFLRLTNAVV